MTARRRAKLDYAIRVSVDVGDSVSDRSGPHDVDAVSPQQRGEHVDDIVIVIDDDQGPTAQFRNSRHRPAGDHHPDRRSRLLRSAIDMTWPIGDFSGAAARAPGRWSLRSLSRSARIAHDMNVSTSRPTKSASSSAVSSTRGLTHRTHRREDSYPINSNRCAAGAPLTRHRDAGEGKLLDKAPAE